MRLEKDSEEKCLERLEKILRAAGEGGEVRWGIYKERRLKLESWEGMRRQVSGENAPAGSGRSL